MAEATFFKPKILRPVTPAEILTVEENEQARQNYLLLKKHQEDLQDTLIFLKDNGGTSEQMTQMQENINAINEQIRIYEENLARIPSRYQIG